MLRAPMTGTRRSTTLVLGAAVAAVALTLGAAPAATAGHPRFDNLEPGRRASMHERIPVQYVFVGYDDVNRGKFRAELPRRAAPIARYPAFYGRPAGLGLHYRFDHSTTVAGQRYENRLFGFLARASVPQSEVDGLDLTTFQQQYNDQETNRLDVADNYFIDGPSVEEWLVNHPAPGVNPRRNTIYFINWWGRDDFRFHTYTKIGEPDPDTGYDFGLNRQSRKMIAWGGTPRTDEETPVMVRGRAVDSRTWFYDLSAGPESWTDNWAVDVSDVDGDGVEDYRMPPIWEYRNDAAAGPGAHPRSALFSDLGLVARYVGINLLMASSPLYSPAIETPRLPSIINLDVNGYEGLPGLRGTRDYFQPQYFLSEEQELVDIPMTIDVEVSRLQGTTERCYDLWLQDVTCDPLGIYPGGANLFFNASKKRPLWRDGGGDYEAGIFHYTTAADRAPGILGFADDNWIDGTQSGVFSFLDPDLINVYGYGLTTTDIHEVGHHLGMSHPHDGYDSATGVDYGGSGAFYFANSGDQTNSIMSYIDVNWDFSTFDRDNAARFYAATYVTTSNTVAEMVLEAGLTPRAAAALARADRAIGRAEGALWRHDYHGAFGHAQSAYGFALAAADAAGVVVEGTDRGWHLVRNPDTSAAASYASVDVIDERSRRARP